MNDVVLSVWTRLGEVRGWRNESSMNGRKQKQTEARYNATPGHQRLMLMSVKASKDGNIRMSVM